MQIAALYDIHGNLPALEAVLEDVRAAGVGGIVVGGDVVLGPMPCETLAALLEQDIPVRFIHGNCELAVLAQIDAGDSGEVKYWGTSSGKPLPEKYRTAFKWTGETIRARYQELVRTWPKTLRVEISGLGGVLFCHGTPRSETEIFTRLTPEDRLLPVFREAGAPMVVCGHTHMQFDRRIGGVRVVNAGSVGSPFGRPGADWLLLGPDAELRHTSYDLAGAAARVRRTAYPDADTFAAESVLKPPAELAMLELFTNASFP